MNAQEDLKEVVSHLQQEVAVLRQVVMNLNEEMKELKASRESEPLPDVGEPFMNTKRGLFNAN
jgi:hypothetical protein